MGASESRNMDKRSVRRQYRDDYQGAIRDIRRILADRVAPNASSGSESNSLISKNASRDIKVFMRKRPIFDKEEASGEFDVISCPHPNKIIIHDARIQSDMRHQYLNNYEFNFDRVFDESASGQEVFEVAAAPLVQTAFDGGYATCIVYGQV